MANEHDTEEERKVLFREIQLFEQRKWEPYILFLVNLILSLNLRDRFYVGLWKSAMDSLFIRKACNIPGYREELISNRINQDILFNDALRLDITVHEIGKKTGIIEVANIIEEGLKNSGLTYDEEIDGRERELILISKGEVPEADKKIVLAEQRESTDEEAEILRKYLLMHFAIVRGI